MKKVILGALMCASALAMTGCGVMPTNVNTMAAINIDHVSSAPFVDNAITPRKKGIAMNTAIICFNTGDSSITEAMRAGGIKKVHHVDYSVFTIFYLYTVNKTIVYGE